MLGRTLSVILLLTQLAIQTHAAFMQPYTCTGTGLRKPFTVSPSAMTGTLNAQSLISDLSVEVMLRHQLLIYKIQFTAGSDVSDVNYTTNMFTTIDIHTNFIGGEVYQKSARLCDYLTVVQDSVFTGPPGGLIVPRNDTFTRDDSLSTIAELFDSDSDTANTNSSEFAWIPGYNTTGLDINKVDTNVCPLHAGTRYQVFYVNKVESDRYFGSYNTRFTIINADDPHKATAGSSCFEVYVTPYHPNYITLTIFFGVLAIFVLGLVSTFYIYNYSSNQESSNVSLLIASSICNEPLLNELTPDVMSMLHYLQFTLFSVCLNLSYPWFLPVILSYMNWAALIRVDIFSSKFINPLAADGVYMTLGRFGLLSIFPVENKAPSGRTISQIWGDFMIWIACCVAFFVLLSNFTVYFSQRRHREGYPWHKALLSSLGVVVQFFYMYFPLPFVAISSFLIWGLITKQDNLNKVAASFAIIFEVVWIGVFLWFFLRNIWRSNARLYSSLRVISVWSPVYNYYKPELVWFVLLDKLKILFDGMVVGYGVNNGLAQLLLLVFANIGYIFLILWYQPFFNRRKNLWTIVLSLLQLLSLLVSVAFIPSLSVNNGVRAVVGDFQLVIYGIVVLLFLVFFVLRTLQVFKRRKNPGGRSLANMSESRSNDSDKKINYAQEESFEDTTDEMIHFTEEDGQSLHSTSSSDIQLTDSRALPGLSLKYVGRGVETRRPTAVSPITYEYLERIEKEDEEVRALWQNRLVRRRVRDDSESWIEKLKRHSVETSTSQEKGFSVVGRKPITVTKEVKGKNMVIHEEDEDAGQSQDQNKGFSVVGRKPIRVKLDAVASEKES
ncbi:CYFA0S19e01662g1_1 [Cyberlindnera fabianii]|uniref:CYFA0S19e01662g1_1 n=1 Tax=Cyberlindnera fabianii TaxID=36022 RepID=A0A061B8I2_CYBFA|nr:CYFA0S19e01662g1_1 [Cyberlindnera fabianii]